MKLIMFMLNSKIRFLIFVAAIFVSATALNASPMGPKEVLDHVSFRYEATYNSNKVRIYLKSTNRLVAEYKTIYPILTLVSRGDLVFAVRIIRHDINVATDIMVRTDNLQITNVKYQTADAKGTSAARKLISEGDPYLLELNKINLIKNELYKKMVYSTEEGADDLSYQTARDCEGFLAGPHSLYEKR